MEGTVFLSILLNELTSFLFMEGKHPHTSMKPKPKKYPWIQNKDFCEKNMLQVFLTLNNFLHVECNNASFAKIMVKASS